MSRWKIAVIIFIAVAIIAGICGWVYILSDNNVQQGKSNQVTTNSPQNSVGQGSSDQTNEPKAVPDTEDVSRFSDLYYYESDKLDRYLAYEASHGELSPDQVVWRVDAKLDMPFYSDIAVIKDTERLPVLVNKYNKFPDDFAPAELVEINRSYSVTPETKEAFLALQAEAKEAGFTLRAGSAYRTIAYQKGLYDRYAKADGADKADTYSSRPGHSEHHTGRTIDLVATDGTLQNFRDTEDAAWVAENAYRFGFIVRYTDENEDITGYSSEPWHITYVGKNAAMVINSGDIGSLEEYFVKYVDHRQAH